MRLPERSLVSLQNNRKLFANAGNNTAFYGRILRSRKRRHTDCPSLIRNQFQLPGRQYIIDPQRPIAGMLNAALHIRYSQRFTGFASNTNNETIGATTEFSNSQRDDAPAFYPQSQQSTRLNTRVLPQNNTYCAFEHGSWDYNTKPLTIVESLSHATPLNTNGTVNNCRHSSIARRQIVTN